MNRRLSILTLALAVAAVSGWAADDEPAGQEKHPDTVSIPTSAAPREVRDYTVSYDIKGKNPGNWLVDTTVTYNIRHSYGRREGDGLLPMEVSLISGHLLAGGQKIEIAPGVYPKLTVLLDRDWKTTDIFGAESRTVQNLRGLNYGNLIVLFYLAGGEKPHGIDESWQSRVKLPALGETFDFTNTIKGVETIDGTRAARVLQEIRPAADESAVSRHWQKCSAESYFSLEDGKLLKSHVECEVKLPSPSSPPGASPDVPAIVKIDINRLKPM